LLAKRARGRGRENRQAKQAAHTGKVHTRRHHSVFAIHRSGQSGDPCIGVSNVQAAKALRISLVSAGKEVI